MAYDATERTSNTKNIRSALKSIHRIPAVRRPLSSTPSHCLRLRLSRQSTTMRFTLHNTTFMKFINIATIVQPNRFISICHSTHAHTKHTATNTQINTDRRNKNRTYWTEQKQKNNAHGLDASVSAHRRFSFIHTSHNVLRLLSSIHITSVYNTHNTHTLHTRSDINIEFEAQQKHIASVWVLAQSCCYKLYGRVMGVCVWKYTEHSLSMAIEYI